MGQTGFMARLSKVTARECAPLCLAVLVVTLFSAYAAYRSSIVLDHERYFWLDDDQMISMRYARNLVEGQGLVWNAGERVEGYSNFGWVMVMAGVHLLPLSDAKTALVIEVLNWGLAVALLLLARRLLRRLVPDRGLEAAILMLVLPVCADVVFWSANGTEFTLIGVLFLWVVDRLFEESATERPRALTYGVLGVLACIRADGLHVWLAAALLALGLWRSRRGLALLALSLLPVVAHLLFRHAYYGIWLPNTYYLKVDSVPGKLHAGLGYSLGFAIHYCLPLLLALLGAITSRQRWRWLLLGGIGISLAYVVGVGGDVYPHFRFLAHEVPVLLVLALACTRDMGRPARPIRPLLGAGLALTVILATGLLTRNSVISKNGSPLICTTIGVTIRNNADAWDRVAVLVAGAVGYFSRHPMIDLLGKSDPHIARLPGLAFGGAGHNKYDPGFSLGRGADLLVYGFGPNQARQLRGSGYNAAVAHDPTFVREFLPNSLVVSALSSRGYIYFRGSSGAARRDAWRLPVIER
jgi:hypothetical protein